VKKSARLWKAFESIPGLTGTLADWKNHLGRDYEMVESFLRPISDPALSVPCPTNPPCDCAHEIVIHRPEDIVGVCRCKPKRCATTKVTKTDTALYKVNRSLLGASIANALGAKPEEKVVDRYHMTWQIGTYEARIGYPIPLILTIQIECDELCRVTAQVAAEAEGPFVLLAPTDDFWNPKLAGLLQKRQGMFIPLSAILSTNGGLSASHPLKEVLAGFLDDVLPPTAEQFIFRKDGATWTVAFHGDPQTVVNSKGMDDIATLLSNPNQEIHCTQLRKGSWTSASSSGDPDELLGDGDNSGYGKLSPKRKQGGSVLVDAVADTEAVNSYKLRLHGLKERIETAEELGDTESAGRLKEEQYTLTQEIARSVGYGGKLRTEGPTKRTRQAVSNAINRALSAIKLAHQPLWKHLGSAIQRGEFLAYRPDQKIRWLIGRSNAGKAEARGANAKRR
jgi:hypothetical protein